MNVLESVRVSASLLSRRDQSRLLFVAILQFAITILDLVGVLLLGLVAALTATAAMNTDGPSGFMGSLVSSLPTSITFIASAALVAAGALVCKSVLSLLLNRRTFRFLANRQALISGQLAKRLLRRPLLEVYSRSSQETTVALTSGVSALMMTILGNAIVLISEMSLVLVLFIGLLFVDTFVAFFTTLFFTLLVVTLHFLLGTWAGSLGREQADVDIASLESIQNAIRTYREVTITGRRDFVVARFQVLRWRAARVQANSFILGQISKYVFEIGLIVGAGLLVVLLSITNDLASGIATITVFLAASGRVFPSLLRFQVALTGIKNAEGVGHVTLTLLSDLAAGEKNDEPSMVLASINDGSAANNTDYVGFEPSVSLSSVLFTYPNASDSALKQISLEVQPSQSIAIVGSTGAGKSTLADIILGVIEPDSGSVLLSGMNPHACVARWPGAMAYVPQDVAVLAGSVRENVALAIPDEIIDDSLVWTALDRAQLSGFLQENREGLDTVVGENGVQLSGGQRQRLGIARALYSKPKLLILDEATSALDAETERVITDTLDSLSGDVTLIVIAHRLATVRNCDQVIYLSNGRIMGQGTFDDVRIQVKEFDRQAELMGL